MAKVKEHKLAAEGARRARGDAQPMARKALELEQAKQLAEEGGVVQRRAELDVSDVAGTLIESCRVEQEHTAMVQFSDGNASV